MELMALKDTEALAWCVLMWPNRKPHINTNRHMTMAMAGKLEQPFCVCEFRYKGGCCCFGQAVFALSACYMELVSVCIMHYDYAS